MNIKPKYFLYARKSTEDDDLAMIFKNPYSQPALVGTIASSYNSTRIFCLSFKKILRQQGLGSILEIDY